MSSNEKVVNYKVLDLVELYNYGIELVYIQSYLENFKILEFGIGKLIMIF